MKQTILTKIAACWFLLVLAACAPGMPAAVPTTTPAPGQPAALPATETSAPDVRTVQSAEYGVSLSYAAGLAESAAVEAVAPVPLSPERMFADAHPGYVSVRFSGYNLKRPYQLAYPLSDPQVMVFRTADFASYANQSPHDFPSSQSRLADTLKAGTLTGRCTTPPTGNDGRMPYLPWTNAAQVFCAQLKTLEFGSGANHGSGIRYLTTFSQGIEPVLEGTVFYTFQGMTDDGQMYVSAVFPVDTGVFAVDSAQGAGMEIDAMRAQLASQIGSLNGKSADQFNPSLSDLDALIESLVIE